MNPEIDQLAMNFARERGAKGFTPKDLFDYLVAHGIDMDEAKAYIDFQMMSMEELDED